MTPAQHYALDLGEGKISPDPFQAEAIQHLQTVYESLLVRWQGSLGLWQTFINVLGQAKERPVKGLYFWGGVGRGKTYLMDLFYQSLPGERKMRMHFHRFMQMVHRGLHEQKGRKNPLDRIAGDIALKVDVICFDEFFVSDIGDAMILGNLFEALLSSGVTLIATSNIIPDSLYKDGLQRERFLPAIALIKKHTQVINMDGGVDYRLRELERAEIFYTPLGERAEGAMLARFRSLSVSSDIKNNFPLEVLGRDIKARYWTEGLVWFDFDILCEGPRSAADYIEISQLFHTVILSNIPVLDAGNEDSARRFISLVDEFYDHNVKLIFSAAASLEQLYQGQTLSFPYERTLSRLLEMQSHEYLALEHNP